MPRRRTVVSDDDNDDDDEMLNVSDVQEASEVSGDDIEFAAVGRGDKGKGKEKDNGNGKGVKGKPSQEGKLFMVAVESGLIPSKRRFLCSHCSLVVSLEGRLQYPLDSRLQFQNSTKENSIYFYEACYCCGGAENFKATVHDELL